MRSIVEAQSELIGANRAKAFELRRQGLTFNNADTASMRARLGPYYAHWKSEFGSTAWGLLEAAVGKLAT